MGMWMGKDGIRWEMKVRIFLEQLIELEAQRERRKNREAVLLLALSNRQLVHTFPEVRRKTIKKNASDGD
jgi:hypothetical protein